MEAWRLRVRDRFARLRPPLPGDRSGAERGFSEFAGDELAAPPHSLPQPPASSSPAPSRWWSAFPRHWPRWRRGTIDVDRVKAMADVTHRLDASQAALVESRVLARGARPTCSAAATTIASSIRANGRYDSRSLACTSEPAEPAESM
ncbi:hypothetical protein [Frankia sp. AgKG'84/4]|uniref:hypothetical protein n=1 Tax=Frankia sp. AgKG'84/4 TaxID=573490 RepID=UPI00200DA152|nr:hypothetical protein [Frankia sp. AgKG'84/4]MCL9793577.1 hypothetical protein [Frankia sp. AgKG'84/4]